MSYRTLSKRLVAWTLSLLPSAVRKSTIVILDALSAAKAEKHRRLTAQSALLVSSIFRPDQQRVSPASTDRFGESGVLPRRGEIRRAVKATCALLRRASSPHDVEAILAPWIKVDHERLRQILDHAEDADLSATGRDGFFRQIVLARMSAALGDTESRAHVNQLDRLLEYSSRRNGVETLADSILATRFLFAVPYYRRDARGVRGVTRPEDTAGKRILVLSHASLPIRQLRSFAAHAASIECYVARMDKVDAADLPPNLTVHDAVETFAPATLGHDQRSELFKPDVLSLIVNEAIQQTSPGQVRDVLEKTKNEFTLHLEDITQHPMRQLIAWQRLISSLDYDLLVVVSQYFSTVLPVLDCPVPENKILVAVCDPSDYIKTLRAFRRGTDALQRLHKQTSFLLSTLPRPQSPQKLHESPSSGNVERVPWWREPLDQSLQTRANSLLAPVPDKPYNLLVLDLRQRVSRRYQADALDVLGASLEIRTTVVAPTNPGSEPQGPVSTIQSLVPENGLHRHSMILANDCQANPTAALAAFVDYVLTRVWSSPELSRSAKAEGLHLLTVYARAVTNWFNTTLPFLLGFEKLCELRPPEYVIGLPGRRPLARGIAVCAGLRQIPTMDAMTMFALPEHFSNPRPAARYLSVVETFQRDRCIEHYGLKPHRVILGGAQRFDAHKSRAAQCSLTEARSHLSINPSTICIAFASQPLAIAPRCADLLAKACRGVDGVTLLLKPHPGESVLSRQRYASIAANPSHSHFCHSLPDHNIFDIIQAADIVCTMFSNVGLEAAVLGKLVVTLDPECIRWPFDLEKMGIGLAARSPAEVVSLIRSLVRDRNFRKEANARSANYLRANRQLQEGRFGRRLVNFLESAVSMPQFSDSSFAAKAPERRAWKPDDEPAVRDASPGARELPPLGPILLQEVQRSVAELEDLSPGLLSHLTVRTDGDRADLTRAYELMLYYLFLVKKGPQLLEYLCRSARSGSPAEVVDVPFSAESLRQFANYAAGAERALNHVSCTSSFDGPGLDALFEERLGDAGTPVKKPTALLVRPYLLIAGNENDLSWIGVIAHLARDRSIPLLVLSKRNKRKMIEMLKGYLTTTGVSFIVDSVSNRCKQVIQRQTLASAAQVYSRAANASANLSPELGARMRNHLSYLVELVRVALPLQALLDFDKPRAVLGAFEKSAYGALFDELRPRPGRRNRFHLVNLQHGQIPLQRILASTRFDTFGVWDEYSAQIVRRAGYPLPKTVQIVGNPAWDQLRQRVDEWRGTKPFRKLSLWSKGHRLIVAFTQPYEDEVIGRFVAVLVDYVTAHPKTKLLIKRHARESQQTAEWPGAELREQDRMRIYRHKSCDFGLALSLADVCVSIASTSLWDAVQVGRKTLAIDLDGMLARFEMELPDSFAVASTTDEAHSQLGNLLAVDRTPKLESTPSFKEKILTLLPD